MRQPTLNEQGLGTHWRKVRRAILARDHYTCQLCGGRANSVDHIVPRSLGGARYDPRNLRACCLDCNRRLGGQLGRQRQLAHRPPTPAGARKVWAGAIDLER